MRGSVGGVCVRCLIIAGCLCFASACMIVCVQVCVYDETQRCVGGELNETSEY